MLRHLVELLVALAGGYAVGAVPVGWLLVRRQRHLDLRRVGGGGSGALDVLRAAGPRAAFLTLVLECLKGAVVAIAASLYSTDAWFVTAAIAGCVTGDAFPPGLGLRRGGRGLVPLVAGLLVGLPGTGTVIAIIAIPTAVLTSMRGRTYEAIVAVAIPLGLLVRTRELAVHLPAAIIVAALLGREFQRQRRRQRLGGAAPVWRVAARAVVVEPPRIDGAPPGDGLA